MKKSNKVVPDHCLSKSAGVRAQQQAKRDAVAKAAEERRQREEEQRKQQALLHAEHLVLLSIDLRNRAKAKYQDILAATQDKLIARSAAYKVAKDFELPNSVSAEERKQLAREAWADFQMLYPANQTPTPVPA